MTRLEDGPAKGQVLMLHRAPLFLRVSWVDRLDPSPWDALDMVEDEPREGEIFYAYLRTGSHGYAFVDFGGKKKHMSGRYSSATYAYLEEQPPQAVMASNEAWQKWCLEQKRP